MIYLYGLTETAPVPGLLADLAGVTGPVQAAQTPVGWLIYGPADSTEILPKRRYMLAHARVQEALLGPGALLPMRFGMVAETLAVVTALLAARADEVARSFDTLRGHVEVGLRIALPKEPALAATLQATPPLLITHRRLSRHRRPPHFEVAEFGRRLAEALETRRARAQKALVAALAPLCASYSLKAPEAEAELLSLAALVPQDDLDRFARAAETAAEAHRGLAGGAEPEIKLVGPVPPFHFVTLSLGDPSSQAA